MRSSRSAGAEKLCIIIGSSSLTRAPPSSTLRTVLRLPVRKVVLAAVASGRLRMTRTTWGHPPRRWRLPDRKLGFGGRRPVSLPKLSALARRNTSSSWLIPGQAAIRSPTSGYPRLTPPRPSVRLARLDRAPPGFPPASVRVHGAAGGPSAGSTHGGRDLVAVERARAYSVCGRAVSQLLALVRSWRGSTPCFLP